ncbi:hypothetical protein Aperf_G00000105906 [Anoplocephala perfoliata]
MGVKGLWSILESARREADLEHFRGKRMAIDMNIWLHQALKSKAKGNHNIHLAILFRRICKLLFYGIRPVFVFDGAVPALKKSTMDTRRANRSTAQEKSLRARNRLLNRLFRRLAENAAKSKKPTKELMAEFVNRYNSTEAIRVAERDEEIFRTRDSSTGVQPVPSSILHLESEQEFALQLARDFILNSSSVDINSDAFNALPIHAQLQVVLILQDSSSNLLSQSSGEIFSQSQVNRLIMRRKLSLKKAEIERKMNESLIGEVMSEDLPDMDVKAYRIASQPEGHAMLLKKRSSKKADDLKERLNRILVGGSIPEPIENLKTDENLIEDVASVSKSVIEPSKTDKQFLESDNLLKEIEDGSLTNEVELKNESQESELSSSDTDGFTDVVDDSSSIKTLDDLALLLIQSRASRLLLSTNETPGITNLCPIANEDIKCMKPPDVSSPEGFSSDSTIILDVTDKSASKENANDLIGSVDQDTCDFDCSIQHSPAKLDIQKDADAISIVNELNEDVGSGVKTSDLELSAAAVEQKDVLDSVETLPQMSSFLISGVDEVDEDDLEIDDDVLRAEADRYERLAQETTSDCIAEAQRLVQLFGFPLIISPEEAEAQCCRLQQLELVDIVASDDSDVWVFGASFVCRHLFGNSSGKPKSKYTSFYSIKDIEERLGLDRRQFIRLALLCGSDYTNGIDKIGPIKALEIISSLCPPSGSNGISTEMDAILQPLEEFSQFCRRGADARWKNIKIPVGFPSEAVVRAYLSPRVEEPSGFQWDTPQMALLTKYPFYS